MQDDNKEKKAVKAEDTCSQKKQIIKRFFLLWVYYGVIFSIIFILIIGKSVFSVPAIVKVIIGACFVSVVNCVLTNLKFCKKE